jgi:Uma2 family endonuclease
MVATYNITTAEQLFAAGDIGRCELLRGELVMMTPASYEHGRMAGRVFALIHAHVVENDLGVVLAAETGFVLARDPDTLRAPDVAFLSTERARHAPSRGYFEGAPDLAVEILSPNDRVEHVNAKVEDWLAAGCRMVWVIDARHQQVAAYTPDRTARTLTGDDVLIAGDVLPGFKVPVAQLFG